MTRAGWTGVSWTLACLALQAALLFPLQSCRDASTSPAKAHSVTYVLDWKHTKLRDRSPEPGWEVLNDLGYTVRVTRAYLVNRSLELVPCDPAPPKVSLLDAIDALITPRAAFAGHSTIPDPSCTKTAEVESLLRVQTKQLTALYPGPQKYCYAHYLIARADPQAAGLPAEVDMVDQTLRFEGSFQRPGGSGFEPFTVVTAVANGKLFDLTTAKDGRLDTGSVSVVVTVRRNLDALFDRVDFATMNEKRIGRELLQNLIDGTEVEVKVADEA